MMRHLFAAFLLLCCSASATANSDNDFLSAQWIGAISRQDARLPQGRNFTGSKLKEAGVKAAWAAVDTLSEKSIVLSRTFRPRYSRQKISRATVYVCGLGFYELAIGRQRVGDAVMAPHWSDYDKTLFYNVYDVTDLCRSASWSKLITLEVLLGNGFYNEQGRRYAKMKISFGPPTLRLRLHIEYRNGHSEDVMSDESWQWALSPITFNSIFGGEDYDARLEPRSWQPAVVQEAPQGRLRRQIAEPVRIMEHYNVADTIRHDSLLVLDMGQNLSGFPEISVSGRPGQWLKLTPGETLMAEGLVNQRQTGRPHYYKYTLRGSGDEEVWHPRFSYYGYRYLQIEGDISVLRRVRSCFVYNSARRIGSFECSNPLLNDAARLIDRAVRSNWQSVWTDCPHREKLGWLEQDWLNGEGLMHTYDCRSMIRQTVRQIADSQGPDGYLPEIAPNLCVFEGSWAPPFLESPEWGGAFIALPENYYLRYGDDSLISEHFDAMRRYVDYLHSRDSCGILNMGLGDWYDYGPGRAGFAQNTSVAFVATAHMYLWTEKLSRMASVIKRTSEARELQHRADSIREAINTRFYNPQHCTYDTGSQCAQSIALEMHLCDDSLRQAVLQRLIDDIHSHGDRLTTGDVGNRYLFNALVNNGHQELLYTMLNHYDVPGYGYQIRLGHTTLTEQWNPEHGASMNHFMMGHISNLLIPRLLGIDLMGGVKIAPLPMGDITWCHGTVETEQGTIACHWQTDNGHFTLSIDLPADVKAAVTMPYSRREMVLGGGSHTFSEETETKN